MPMTTNKKSRLSQIEGALSALIHVQKEFSEATQNEVMEMKEVLLDLVQRMDQIAPRKKTIEPAGEVTIGPVPAEGLPESPSEPSLSLVPDLPQ